MTSHVGRRAIWTLRRSVNTFRREHRHRASQINRSVNIKHVQSRSSLARRSARAMSSILRNPDPSGPIWAVTMVKNEADIIEETIQTLVAQGIDQILVADNNSTDATREILERLARDLPIIIVDDPLVAYWQAEKMTRLAQVATSLGASWIVPFDADELWFGEGSRTVAEVLRSTSATIVTATWWQFLPVNEQDGVGFAQRHGYRQLKPEPYKKLAFRANWLARIGLGNHWVDLPDMREQAGLRIAHFRYRSREQMVRKIRDGVAGLRAGGIGNDLVSHWWALADADDDAVHAYVQELIVNAEPVFDPASLWSRS